MEINDTNKDIWQIESDGEIVETRFDEMTSWIVEGSLLKIDRVRRGELRWIEAGKVPSLIEFFNAKDAAAPAAPVITMTHKERLGVVEQRQTFVNPTAESGPVADVCSMHADAPAKYVCETCTNLFCKACPSSYGSNVKICPFCGAMCTAIVVPVDPAKTFSHVPYRAPLTEGFGFADLGKALAYPFRFKASLIMGAIMFMFLSVGQGVVGFGGIFMMFSALVCFLLANTLTFGILANTVNNFSQGKLDENFMPAFDDFNIWEDVIHPFFLSIGVYVVSFGPLVLMIVIGAFFLVSSATNEMNGLQSDAARTVAPELPYAANAAKQSDVVRKMVGDAAEYQRRRVEQMQKGQIEPGQAPDMSGAPMPDGEDLERTNQMIQDARRQQLESAVGKTPETVAKERAAMTQQFLKKGLLFLLLAGAAGLWGLFYFPAASAVAGYTRSLGATLNPFVGLDTIRHLGLDYVKILLMGLVLALASGAVGAMLAGAFSAFDMPGVGNVPARAIGSLFGFYLSVVFSCVIAFALYKASDRLKLVR